MVRSAKRASNPKGLKNVASIKAMVFSLFKFIDSSSTGFVHNGKFFHKLAPYWKKFEEFELFSVYIRKNLETKG